MELNQYLIKQQPYYVATAAEVEIFENAFTNKLPVLLKGPTGCGKTRFIQYMAWRLKRPLITVGCNDDLTAADLVGRYLLVGGETRWCDGPLTQAVRGGAICYLDEVVEARNDTTVVIHSLTDDRRVLAVDKTGEFLHAPAEFCLVVSFNPGYQSVLKDLKQSTRQRFVGLEFNYPSAAAETEVIVSETNLDINAAAKLVKLGEMTRNLKGRGLDEGASTRLLVHAGKLIAGGVATNIACRAAVAETLTDDPDTLHSINELIKSLF